MDNRNKWIKYDAAANWQIEKAWKAKQPYVQLNQGEFFGITQNRNVFLIGLSPSNLCQTNTKTNHVRKVRRSDELNPSIAKNNSNNIYAKYHNLPSNAINSYALYSVNNNHSEHKRQEIEQLSNCLPNDNLQFLISSFFTSIFYFDFFSDY